MATGPAMHHPVSGMFTVSFASKPLGGSSGMEQPTSTLPLTKEKMNSYVPDRPYSLAHLSVTWLNPGAIGYILLAGQLRT